MWERAMPAIGWSPAWRLYALGCSYRVMLVARMAASYREIAGNDVWLRLGYD